MVCRYMVYREVPIKERFNLADQDIGSHSTPSGSNSLALNQPETTSNCACNVHSLPVGFELLCRFLL